VASLRPLGSDDPANGAHHHSHRTTRGHRHRLSLWVLLTGSGPWLTGDLLPHIRSDLLHAPRRDGAEQRSPRRDGAEQYREDRQASCVRARSCALRGYWGLHAKNFWAPCARRYWKTAERVGVHHLLAALSGRVPRHEAARADDDRGTKIHAWRPRPCVITRPSALDGCDSGVSGVRVRAPRCLEISRRAGALDTGGGIRARDEMAEGRTVSR
jgi:hypothetical protein